MAKHSAIATVSAALKGVLMDARVPALGNPTVDVFQLNEFTKGKPSGDGVGILLYRVGVSERPRTLTGRLPINAPARLPPLPVDLHYLAVPWGRSASIEHRLLGWVMRTIEDVNVLHAGLLNQYGGEETFEEGESVALVPESFSMQDLENTWELFGSNVMVSMGYAARMVYLDSDVVTSRGAPVTVRDFEMAQVE